MVIKYPGQGHRYLKTKDKNERSHNSHCIFGGMKCKIKAFGITRDILGSKEVNLEVPGTQVIHLRNYLSRNYPALNDLNSLLIAVNQNYAADDLELDQSDEIVLIPPVSGG